MHGVLKFLLMRALADEVASGARMATQLLSRCVEVAPAAVRRLTRDADVLSDVGPTCAVLSVIG